VWTRFDRQANVIGSLSNRINGYNMFMLLRLIWGTRISYSVLCISMQVCMAAEVASEHPEQEVPQPSRSPIAAATAASFSSPLSYITAAQFCGDLLHNIYQQQAEIRGNSDRLELITRGPSPNMTDAILAALSVMLRSHLNRQDGMPQSMPVHLSFFRSLLWSLEQMHPWVLSRKSTAVLATSSHVKGGDSWALLHGKLYDTALLALDLRPSSAALIGNIEKSHMHAAKILMLSGLLQGRPN